MILRAYALKFILFWKSLFMHLGTGLEAFKASRTPLGGFLEAPGGVFWCLRVLLDKNMQKSRSQPILQGGSKNVIFVYAKKTLIFTVPLGFCRENQKNASQNNCPAACLLDNYQVKSLKSMQDHHQNQAWGGWITKLSSNCPGTCLLDNFKQNH